MEPKDTNSGDAVESPDAPPVADAGENPTPATAPGPVAVEPAAVEPAATVTTGPEPEAAVTAVAAEPEPAGAPESAPDAARRRPRGRTSLIWLAAAVLGVVVGGAVGYGVQADRDPTPLGTLAQKNIAYPAKPLAAGKVPDPLPASEDHQVKTDGDLTKMVVSPPGGAKKDDYFGSGWIDMADFSAWYENPDYIFGELAGANVRRIARQSWLEGDRETKIDLVQYRSGSSLGAKDHFDDQMEYLPYEDGAGNEGDPIKGSLEGRYFLYPVDREEGYEPTYQARAIAVRGDIVMDVVVFDIKPISKKTIRTLAERQLERL
ncbi:hypothetical protein [Streptomyces sp. NBC_01335]|uniref:hypothetical protein n=1 Tax=Streptomyces sp. NBC_01335 TaxID=2903828 RepID=UPI002E12B48A